MNICEGLLSELNNCRVNPVAYASSLSYLLSNFQDFPEEKLDFNLISSDSDRESLQSCVDYLNTIQQMSELSWSSALAMAAQEIINDIWETKKYINCASDEKKKLEDKISAVCEWSGLCGENIYLGNSGCKGIIASMLIGTSDSKNIQRKNILNMQHKFAGIAYRHHKTLGSICAIIFVESVDSQHPLTRSVKEKPQRCGYTTFKETPYQNSGGILDDTKKADINKLEETRSLEISEISEGDIREIQNLFEGLDNDISGTINASDIKSFLESARYERNYSSIYEALKGVDFGTAEKLSIGELIETLKCNSRAGIKNYSFNNEEFSEIKSVFDLIDCDKSGFITQKSISFAMQNESLESYSIITHELNLELDSSQDKEISFERFSEIALNHFNSSRLLQNNIGETCKSAIYASSKQFPIRKSSYEQITE